MLPLMNIKLISSVFMCIKSILKLISWPEKMEYDYIFKGKESKVTPIKGVAFYSRQ